MYNQIVKNKKEKSGSHRHHKPAAQDVLCALPTLFLNNQLCFALYSASLAMTKVYRPLLTDTGITYPQYIVLLALWQTDGLTVSMLGLKVALDSGTLTPLLKRMEKACLIDRRRNPADEREVVISLTSSGRTMYAAASAIETDVRVATAMSSDAARKLTRVLSRLRSSLLAHTAVTNADK